MDLLGILRIKDSNGNWVSVPGLKGDTGEPFKILGIYATAADLEAAVTDPGVGDVYLVGTTGAYDIYLYLADGWHNTGRYMPKGDQGDPAPQSAITSAVETWLAANVDPETGYVLDRTLSLGNAAAPADLVGDIKNGLNETAGINITEFSGYLSKRFEIVSDSAWQTDSYVNILNFPVKNGDIITCGCKELKQYGSTVGEIQVFNSSGSRITAVAIPASAKSGEGFEYKYTIASENAHHINLLIYGVGSSRPAIGDYTYIGDAYCMIAEAEIPSKVIKYKDSNVEAELDNMNSAIDNMPLKSIINEKDIILYRDNIEYTATGSGSWQGGYQIDITIPVTEEDTIYMYCDDFNTYGKYIGSLQTLDENGATIYQHSIASRQYLQRTHLAAVKIDAGAVSAKIMLALITTTFEDHVPSAGDVAYMNHLVFFKNEISIKPFVSVAAIDNMDKSAIYALPSEWSNKIQTVQNAQQGKFTFAVQTDTHFGDIGTGIFADSYNDLINNLSKLTEYIGFDFICNLGDIIRGYEADITTDMLEAYTELMHRYVTNLQCPLMVIPGNHDTNRMYAEAQEDPSLQIQKETIYSKIIPFVKNSNPLAVFDGRSLYYYVDFEESGIRAIFLNIADDNYSSSTYGGVFTISAAQLNWFQTKALDTDKAIAVFCHCPLVDGLTANSVTNNAAVMNAIYDFKNNGGTVVGCFYGHTHVQNSKTDESGVLHVTFTFGGTCAEVVMVDVSNRTISTIGIGSDTRGTAVADRAFTF